MSTGEVIVLKMSRAVKRAVIVFTATLIAILAIFGASVIKNHAYNSKKHYIALSGDSLFAAGGESGIVSVSAAARSDTWTKVLDINNEGITEPNYRAYTYDFTVSNDTRDEVSDFNFKVTFSTTVYLASAWNGSLEVHQHVGKNEIVDTIPDLRVFEADKHILETVTLEERELVAVHKGDYIIYTPSSTANAMEVPIEPHEATTPGCILYAAIGEDITDSVLELEYMFNRKLTSEVLFRIAATGSVLWVIALTIFVISFLQIRKYTVQHERDDKIISESIETFTGFIDAKDPYTNGHSKRVAIYTRLIAKEMGYAEDELERIYYVALLHDCGKIGVPDNILGKPGKLTDEEFAIIKTHTNIGADILSSFRSLKNASEGALYHHERYDGKGYPEGKAGEDIPLIARIICVADSFDAMNTNRVYRARLTKEQIIDEIEKNSGTQFDPDIAAVMLRLIRSGEINI